MTSRRRGRADLEPARHFSFERQAVDVPPEIAALGAFRRAPTDADIVTSAAPRTSGAQEPPTEFGHDRRLSRRVLETPEGAVFHVAGRSRVGQQRAGSRMRADASHEPARGVRVLPNGADNVEVIFSDGSVEPLKVADNAYSIRTTIPQPLPESIRWDDADGHHVVGTSMPRNANDVTRAGGHVSGFRRRRRGLRVGRGARVPRVAAS